MLEINGFFVNVQTLLKHAQIDFSLRSLNATEITLFWDILAHSAAHAHIHSVHTTHSLDTHTHKFVTVIVLVVLSIQKWPKVTGTKQ